MAIAEQKINDTRLEMSRDQFNEWFAAEFDRAMQERQAAHIPSMTIIATKGTLDMAYPPFILATTAAALGWDVTIFFTFYGLDLLKNEVKASVSPLGNPAMPMKMPHGPEWFRNLDWNIPNALASNIPGFESFATTMMKATLEKKGVASIEELRAICIESDVKLVACQMTVDLFGHDKADFIPEIADWIGATSYLPIAQQSDINLFV